MVIVVTPSKTIVMAVTVKVKTMKSMMTLKKEKKQTMIMLLVTVEITLQRRYLRKLDDDNDDYQDYIKINL